MIVKQNERFKAKGEASTARPDAKSNPKRKAPGGLGHWVPKKAHSEKICQHLKPMVPPTEFTILVTVLATTRMVSSLGQPQVCHQSPRSPSRSLRAIRAWATCRHVLGLYKSQEGYSKSKKSKKHEYDSIEAVPTVNRKLGATTRGLM